ncbi:putative mitochondrial ferredoxin NADP reductase-like protein [Leptomonas pyrrhocoris]|uniref:Putative mitochondrial ferredoxin NADP reductase-like protein n=1 Tax=Leptomonas pyrrhocoris TaxID=157538 RepID=A0A0M9FXJ2_LEPPY|nr:putative mitochondrial ferredoxin NADP reductase-like protein [Leptomonas pyrrhocoris]KPA78160.1 putative mitochondrial ferredoxin NADP reductase-like protein [Leptomonas pyrrhocoris]|eukprot:XP_015656599.1 putative mitochondrial ferredoxin NADP reductase-like protein [Leptomonas pyrrhocoris]
MFRSAHILRYRATTCRLLLSPLAAVPPLSIFTATAPSHFVTPLRWCSTSTASADTPPSSSSPKRKVQIAVVGSGPSGCFVANQLVKKHTDLHVDIFERLPVPFGLCRYGVAPDHPDVKNVEKQFMELFQGGRVTWIGNVSIGREIPVGALLSHYAAVVFATGAEGSKKLGIPGEDLAGVISARSFVEYYNTYPFPFGSPRFCPFDVEKTRRAIVIGNGNVAMDVVRVLGGSYKYFCPTDMNCVCLQEMMRNRIDHISITGRRGVDSSAFATAEFRELTKYQEGHVKVEVDPFELNAAVAAVPDGKTSRAHTRMMELVHQFAIADDVFETESTQLATDADGVPLPSAAVAQLDAPPSPSSTGSRSSSSGTPPTPVDRRGPCTLRFRYNLTPVAILPSRHRKNYVGGVLFRKTPTANNNKSEKLNRASGDGEKSDDEFCVLPCDLVLTSIGYRTDSIADVPFNERAGVIDNVHGRVKGMPRVYCAGWAKNGAKGVILHSVVDAQETVASMLADIEAGIIPKEATVAEEDHQQHPEQQPPQPQAQQPPRDEEPQPTDAQPQLLTVEAAEAERTASGRESAPSSSSSAVADAAARTTMAGKYGLVDYFVDKKLQPVSVAGLQRIFHVEHERGVDLGKKAEKIDSVRDMLDVALGGDVGRKADERIRRITPARSDAMMYLKELLDDDTDLAPLAHELAKDMPRKLAPQHPLGRISPDQL